MPHAVGADGAGTAPVVDFRLAGFMHPKLPERVAGMRALCSAVQDALLSSESSRALLGRFRGVHVVTTVDDLPVPEASPHLDRIEEDGSATLHMQTVGSHVSGPSLWPDFTFGSWWHIGLHDYDRFVAAIHPFGRAHEHAQAFWIGNIEMHPSRQLALAMSRKYPERIDARSITWAHHLGNVTEATGERARVLGGWVTLQEHAKWRYLLDLPGTGWSGRLKLLPHCQRVLLLPARDLWDWASSKLQPFKHYVPLRDDLSDLLDALDTLDRHPERAQAMARAASEVAAEVTFAAAVAHAANLTMQRLEALVRRGAHEVALEGDGLGSRRAAGAKRSRWQARLSAGKRAPSSIHPLSPPDAQHASSPAHEPSPAAPSSPPPSATCTSTTADATIATVNPDEAASLMAAQQQANAAAEAAAPSVRAAAATPTVYLVRGRKVAIHPISNSMPLDIFASAVPRRRHARLPLSSSGASPAADGAVPAADDVESEAVSSDFFAVNVPGNRSTYVFEDESAYLRHYRRAYFGITRKKTGWDAARHLEILASGSVPYFVDLQRLPARTLSLYPRSLLMAALALPGVSVERSTALLLPGHRGVDGVYRPRAPPYDGRWYLDRANFRVDPSVFNRTAHAALAVRLLAHARTHLTTIGMARYALHVLGLSAADVSPVLFVTHCSEDFTGDALLHGFEALLGKRHVIDVAFDSDGAFAHPWCDDSHRAMRTKPFLRQRNGTGRTQARRFSLYGHYAADELAPSARAGLADRIRRHEFRLVIFGSAARTVGGLYAHVVASGMERHRVAFVYGEDLPYPLDAGWPMEGVQRPSAVPPTVPSIAEASRVGVVFQRELYDEPRTSPLTEQTLAVPGVADIVERGLTEPIRWPLAAV